MAKLVDKLPLVFVIRRTADWAQLSAGYRSNGQVPSQRHTSPHSTPGFPRNLEELIARWNNVFGLNFFACRDELKRIAQNTLRGVTGASIEAYTSAADLKSRHPTGILFHLDDDDWFAPDTFDVVQTLAHTDVHVFVFPVVRLAAELCTHKAPGYPDPPALVGPPRDFGYAFLSNNYGIRIEKWPAAELALIRDHTEGSKLYLRGGHSGRYINRIISVGNKSPATITLLKRTQKAADLVDNVVHYIRVVEAVRWPAEVAWAETPARASVALFKNVLSSQRAC